MLAKCINPFCGEHFRYLHQGRIFNIEINPPAPGEIAGAHHRIEHFWLCEQCARRLKVVLENGAVTTKPLHLELADPDSVEQECIGPKPG